MCGNCACHASCSYHNWPVQVGSFAYGSIASALMPQARLCAVCTPAPQLHYPTQDPWSPVTYAGGLVSARHCYYISAFHACGIVWYQHCFGCAVLGRFRNWSIRIAGAGLHNTRNKSQSRPLQIPLCALAGSTLLHCPQVLRAPGGRPSVTHRHDSCLLHAPASVDCPCTAGQ